MLGVDPTVPAGSTRLEVIDGQDQLGRVGTVLPAALTAKVMTEAGVPMPGVSVRWTFSAGGGTQVMQDSASAKTEMTAVTDKRGLTQIYWRLGTQIGTQEATVTLAAASPAPSSAPGNGNSYGKAKFNSHARAGDPDHVVVSPNAATIRTGSATKFTATVYDRWDNVVFDAPVVWAADPATVTTVDGTGLAKAMSEGAATITASSGDVYGSASVSVASPSKPETVTDLSVAAVTAGAITLSWTQVDDGSGNPARYALRFGEPPLVWETAASTEVSIDGTAIGSPMDYTFTDLSPATAYEFRVVAYRGTIGVDAELGAVSDVASASTEAPSGVDRVTVIPGSLYLTALGGESQLHATALDASGEPVESDFRWQSLDPAIASVDETGLVTAVANGTTVVIVSATCCAPVDSVPVKVEAPTAVVASVTASPESVSLSAIGAAVQLTAVARDASGTPVATALEWRSLDASVAGVDANGRVTALANGETRVIVSATCCAAADTVAVSVAATSAPAVTSVTADPSSASLSALGSVVQLSATARDGSGAIVEGPLEWRSLNASVATVDATGRVTAQSNGTALIVVSPTCCAAADTVPVSVAQVPQTLALSPGSLNLHVGGSASLSATVRDANGYVVSGASVSWSSSAPSVATVSGAGLVSGAATGSTTITASSGSVSGTAPVSVTAAPVDAKPGAVTDLAVLSLTDSTVTLRWTQVDDGTGSPARYALRYGTPTLAWGAAYPTEVSLTGSAIGATQQYTFRALSSGTPYEFGLVSYRGTLDAGAVFGPLSNTVAATTTTTVTGTPTVTLSPASVSLTAINATATLTAVARDGTGAVVSSPGFTWKSLNTAIADVNASGVVTAKSVGTVLITVAAACCGADTTSVTRHSGTQRRDRGPLVGKRTGARSDQAVRGDGQGRQRLHHRRSRRGLELEQHLRRDRRCFRPRPGGGGRQCEHPRDGGWKDRERDGVRERFDPAASPGRGTPVRRRLRDGRQVAHGEWDVLEW